MGLLNSRQSNGFLPYNNLKTTFGLVSLYTESTETARAIFFLKEKRLYLSSSCFSYLFSAST